MRGLGVADLPDNQSGEDAAADKAGPGKPGSVLFVCGMNCIRSPMAEYLTRHLFGSMIHVASAGVNSGDLDPFAASVMEERGVPMKAHHSKTLDELEESWFDLVVTLTPEAHHKALELTRTQPVEVEYWATLDPSTVAGNREQILQSYREVRDRLESRIRERFGNRG